MYFLALAADFDGTIAQNGTVNAETVEALRELKTTGRRLLLVTGRELVDLKRAFPELGVFDRIVAENGAVIYDPITSEVRTIAPPPPAAFVQKLVERNVEPISVGHSIVATWHPHETTVLQVIQELGLELHIVFNKGAVMVLPENVNKMSGLRAALDELNISPLNVVAVGDAENDSPFMHACGCAAAVANALPVVSATADIRLMGDHGAGVIELTRRIMEEDMLVLPLSRRGILAGSDRLGHQIYLDPAQSVLLAGGSGSGKTNFAIMLTERMVSAGFVFCIIDPEGDYLKVKDAIVIGGQSQTPATGEIVESLLKAGVNVVVNALALTLPERRNLVAALLPKMHQLRATSGRPHWLLVDEAHHALSVMGHHLAHHLGDGIPATMLITMDPASLARGILKHIDVIVAFGSTAPQTLASFATALDTPPPSCIPVLARDEVLVWMPRSGLPPRAMRRDAPHQDHFRHTGKYAVGDVGEQRSFYFRGPHNILNLRAQNLADFVRILDEIDEPTWKHHLRSGDYSAWFRNVLLDDTLASMAAAVEQDEELDFDESRRRIHEAICSRYSIPVTSS